MIELTEIKVRVTFIEEVLGTAPSNKEIYKDYIASKLPENPSTEEEVGAIQEDDKGITVFPRTPDGKPFFYDYQWKGYFKDCCGMLRNVPGSLSSKLTSYKKKIDGLIFIKDRMNPIEVLGEMGECQRPLRASTAQGERISLANSETIPAGSTCEFTIVLYDKSYKNIVLEWLEYGRMHGTGCWRNSGKGKFTFEILSTENDSNHSTIIVEDGSKTSTEVTEVDGESKQLTLESIDQPKQERRRGRPKKNA